MTGTTSSTPELRIVAGGVSLPAGVRAEVPGHGELRVHSDGHAPGEQIELRIGDRTVALVADAEGTASWIAPGLLDQIAGEVRVAVGEREARFVVRPGKLVTEALLALVAELEAVAEGMALAAGGMATIEGAGSSDRELSALDAAVGLAADAAPGIRRRPIHRSREVVRAVPREGGVRSAADVRWLATHPAAAARAAAAGRPVGVARERRADLDTLENRGVLAAYDRMEQAVDELRAVVAGETARLEAARPAREALLTEHGSLWEERDLPRYQALSRRMSRLDELVHEIGATRSRSGLPDLRPRGPRMVRTPRVDAEPAYWATFRAFLLADRARIDEPPAPAPVRTLDELWEQWCTVVLLRVLREHLGPPDGGTLVDRGWFSTLRSGPVARWSTERRTVRVCYEPEIGSTGELRKLHPGRPWRPDVTIEVRWADGTLDLHVLDAKYRREAGGPPWSALRELWWKYGESIGGPDGLPVVRSIWALWPGEGISLAGPAMLDPRWPIERLRGGLVGMGPGRAPSELEEILPVLLALPESWPDRAS